jgi:hypothetical protein
MYNLEKHAGKALNGLSQRGGRPDGLGIPSGGVTAKKEIRYWTSRAARGVPHPIYRLGISNRNIFDRGGGPNAVCGVTIREASTKTNAGWPGIVAENRWSVLLKPFK